MSDDPLHQPHDKLFKAGFRDPVNAAAFLRDQFSPGLSAAILWDALRLEPGTFVDSQFRESESDLLFSAPVSGAPCFLYILFEHQRIKDPWIALRLLRYMVRIWEEFLKNSPLNEKLPVILPVVLAHNAESWSIPTRFAELLELPADLAGELAGQVPDFVFRLVQLAEMPFDKIVGTPVGVLILRTLKAERREELLGDEIWDEALLERVPGEIFERVLRYIFASADLDKAKFHRRVKSLREPKIKETAMTLAQQFREEGLSQGLSQGRLLALKEDVIEVLTVRFEQVPDGLKEAICEINDDARLRAFLKAALRAASLEDFSRSL